MENFNTEEAAEYLHVSAGTLENWRSQGIGPAFCKPLGKVYYLKDDLDAWIASGRVLPANNNAAE